MSFENTPVKDVCRVCLEKSYKLYPLQGRIPNVDEDISSMINYCTLIQVAIEENLPTGVCVPCFRTIRIAYNFIRQFRESNTILLENRVKQEYNSKEHDSSCEIEYKREELAQYHNNENVEEIIIQFEEDTTNVGTIEENCENEEIRVYNEDGYVQCNEDDLEDNSEETNVEAVKCQEDISLNEEVQNEVSEEPAQPSNRKNTLNFICPICEQSFLKFEVGFVKHLQTHKGVKLKCNKCSLRTILTTDLYVQHFRKAHRFQCNICNKSYGRRSGLYYHIKTHDDRKVFKCSYINCGKSFLTAWCLRKHIHTHSESLEYVCKKCGSEFKTYATYKYHQMTHDGIRNYLCTECGQSFLQSIHLKYHMWKHSGIKMFQCDKCHKSYTSQTKLKNHKKKHICETVCNITNTTI